jgi:bifunctional DNA-binding transcriptional regulator/antitoxin component of YhaV-PrlF toxin-antitoxin module
MLPVDARRVSTPLTDRDQTSVPETVRRALRLGKRDKIRYAIRPDGEVVITRAAYESADDAYRVFRRMLVGGRPPSGWGQLLAEARAESERPGRLPSGSARASP